MKKLELVRSRYRIVVVVHKSPYLPTGYPASFGEEDDYDLGKAFLPICKSKALYDYWVVVAPDGRVIHAASYMFDEWKA